jgi:steroid delta-isomerase-like uncharacterized protein
MTSQDVVDRYIAAWNDHDPAAVQACFTEDGTYEDPATGGPLSGAAIAAYARANFEGFPDMHFDVPNVMRSEDGRAAFEWVMRATNAGPFAGQPATNLAATLPGADFLTLDGDRIASLRGYWDVQTVRQQLQGG